nr:MAG TPA: hypothetical protein [Caudoviricetes sp.]
MKNREKYREEIVKNARAISGDKPIGACEFTRRNVLPKFGDGVRCYSINCAWCRFLVDLWLDEEYEEPEVDWDKVPVDTLVRVRDREEQEWTLMYFKGISDYDRAHRFMTWCDGATSKTASGGDYVRWKYCELVEDEDNDK